VLSALKDEVVKVQYIVGFSNVKEGTVDVWLEVTERKVSIKSDNWIDQRSYNHFT